MSTKRLHVNPIYCAYCEQLAAGRAVCKNHNTVSY